VQPRDGEAAGTGCFLYSTVQYSTVEYCRILYLVVLLDRDYATGLPGGDSSPAVMLCTLSCHTHATADCLMARSILTVLMQYSTVVLS
jgi:hypothetical protein